MKYKFKNYNIDNDNRYFINEFRVWRLIPLINKEITL